MDAISSLAKKVNAFGINGMMKYAGYKIFGSRQRVALKAENRKKWAAVGKDIVALHQLPRSPVTPSPSPFPLKLETYLRMASIPYQVDYSEPFGPKRKTPWITFNGQEIGDSQLIMEMLAKEFGKDFSSHLTPEEKAVARSLRIMAEEHFFWVMVLWRFVYTKGSTLPQVMPFVVEFTPMLEKKWKNAAFHQGMGRHSEEEAMSMAVKDLEALSVYLGKKPFFMGDKPIEVDCSLFAILAQVKYVMPGGRCEKVVREELVNLTEYVVRMKEKFWPDWDEVLAPLRK